MLAAFIDPVSTERKMTLRRRRLVLNLCAAAACGFTAIAWCGASYAALGESASKIDAEQTHMKAARRITSQAAYQVHELTQPSGAVVREFVDAGGNVFAVTWSGPYKPDLSMLLGKSFPRFVEAGSAPHASHRELAIRAPDLVVESQGRMRAFT